MTSRKHTTTGRGAPLADTEKWESGELGRSEAHVKVAGPEAEVALDQATGLQPISIRLPAELIKQYKFAASILGLGYQPLMRDAIERAIKQYLMEAAAIAEAQVRGAKAAEARRSPGAAPVLCANRRLRSAR